jgi:HAD superfamily hydrolase (TIGR01490 family)
VACVLVDVDGTLLEGAGIERLFVAHLWHRRLLGARQIAAGLGFFLRFGLHYGWLIAVKDKAYLAGLGVNDIARIADAFIHERLSGRVRRSMLERLQTHRAAGEPVMLLSGAPDFLVHPLAELVGAHAVAATVCAQKNGVFTANPPVCHPFYRDKVIVAMKRCAELGFTLGECTAYADDAYDVPLLSQVGYPVAVCPDRRLRRAARRQGWEIIET